MATAEGPNGKRAMKGGKVLTGLRWALIVLLVLAALVTTLFYAAGPGAEIYVWRRGDDPLQERVSVQVSERCARYVQMLPTSVFTTQSTQKWIVVRKQAKNIVLVVSPNAIPPGADRTVLVPLGQTLGIRTRRIEWGVPLWVLFVLFIAYPVVAFIRGPVHRRILARRARLAVCCRQCGYNLTGNVSGICPECGQPTKGGSRA
jgi:hypothetical protein